MELCEECGGYVGGESVHPCSCISLPRAVARRRTADDRIRALVSDGRITEVDAKLLRRFRFRQRVVRALRRVLRMR